ncbi:toxin-antitoxin system YwqK family antitoxin [Rufibacter hautae]|uniref:Toxin-antitoxin system YwqK family antitoxin n=1 Tax=Rufibacter hautae TaxID=2595005 RepID=A0A5B6TDN1_9BACT|nr:hypothetical protein [Rufibacter hautae]KAA3438266.1 hypothetical protein FOA19_13485 [Rufibacter hautae]
MEKTLNHPSLSPRTWMIVTIFQGLIFVCPPAQAWPWSWNRYDAKQLKNGRWRAFHDYEEKVLHYKGRYRHGKEVGVWKTFTADGNLYFTEKIKRRDKSYKTVYYHPNGKVSHRGMAYLRDAEDGGVQFYWEGDWEYFDLEGRPLGVKTFVKGNPTTNTPVFGSVRGRK